MGQYLNPEPKEWDIISAYQAFQSHEKDLELNWSFDLNIGSIRLKQLNEFWSGSPSTKYRDQTTTDLTYPLDLVILHYI